MMGFQKPNLSLVKQEIGKSLIEIWSPYNDGWTASACKKDLYLLKCWLEDQYNKLPQFSDEADWEKERLISKLKE